MPLALELAAAAKRLFRDLRDSMPIDPEKLAALSREAKLKLELSARDEEIAALKERHDSELQAIKGKFRSGIEALRPKLHGYLDSARTEDRADGLLEAIKTLPAHVAPLTASSPLPEASHTPERKLAARGGRRVPLMDLFDGWALEKKPRAKTIDDWRRCVEKFIAFLGHDDAARVSRGDAVRWKDELVRKEQPSGKRLSPGTINEKYLASLRTISAYGLLNEKLTENPFLGVKVLTPRGMKDRNKWKPFDDAEASLLLREARAQSGWRKWIPFVCAYTGARVEEVAGAMVADVQCEDGVHFIDLRESEESDEVGGKRAIVRELKNTASIRRVPLHPALVDEGFLAYVGNLAPKGALFPDAKPDKYGKRGAGPSKVLGRRIRQLGCWRAVRIDPPKRQVRTEI
ncbi:hypothetical protein QT386_21660 [Solimonas sp. SE-A11]|nr:hypothetical protein [Solimonas sp. SE-A11]MDM4772811.1 hypothetical protein [Solimonas sp. SE-A11]